MKPVALAVVVIVVLSFGFLFFVPVVPIDDYTCFFALFCPVGMTSFPARVSISVYMFGSGGLVVGKPYYPETYKVVVSYCYSGGTACVGGQPIVSLPLTSDRISLTTQY